MGVCFKTASFSSKLFVLAILCSKMASVVQIHVGDLVEGAHRRVLVVERRPEL